MKNFIIVSLIIVLCFVFVFGGAAYMTYMCEPITEETEIISAEVTQSDFAESDDRNTPKDTRYILGVKWDGGAKVITVKADVYAKYKVGDIVELKITITTNRSGVTSVRYSID